MRVRRIKVYYMQHGNGRIEAIGPYRAGGFLAHAGQARRYTLGAHDADIGGVYYNGPYLRGQSVHDIGFCRKLWVVERLISSGATTITQTRQVEPHFLT